MNILCCFKIIPDLEALTEEDFLVDEALQIDTGFVKKKWNCFDESALEMLLKLSDLSGGFNVIYNLYALTVGGEYCESFLKTLYGLKFHQAIRIAIEEHMLDPDIIAACIAAYVKKNNYFDVIVMGNESEDGQTGRNAFVTAEKLGWPCISQVTGLEPLNETELKVQQKTDEGVRQQIVRTPMLLVVGDIPDSYLRVPTLKDRMRLAKQKTPVLSVLELMPEESREKADKIELTGLVSIRQEREGRIIAGASIPEMVEKLYEGDLKDKVKQP